MDKKLSKTLDKLAMQFLKNDVLLKKRSDKGMDVSKYSPTPEDIMNATIIFNSVTSNFGVLRGVINTIKKSQKLGKDLRDLVFERTLVDTKKFYNKKKRG